MPANEQSVRDAEERRRAAIAAYERALALDPTFSPAWVQRGQALYMLGS